MNSKLMVIFFFIPMLFLSQKTHFEGEYQPAIFPGCEKYKDAQEISKCFNDGFAFLFQKEIGNTISTFYPIEIKKEIHFLVRKDGVIQLIEIKNVEEIKGDHNKVDEIIKKTFLEVREQVGNSIVPATYNGATRSVEYMMPFRLSPREKSFSENYPDFKGSQVFQYEGKKYFVLASEKVEVYDMEGNLVKQYEDILDFQTKVLSKFNKNDKLTILKNDKYEITGYLKNTNEDLVDEYLELKKIELKDANGKILDKFKDLYKFYLSPYFKVVIMD